MVWCPFPTGFFVYDGDITESSAHIVDLTAVIRRIPEIVKIVNPGAGRLHEWNGWLARDSFVASGAKRSSLKFVKGL